METEQEAIIREVQAFSEAWSHGDAKAAASFYTDDGIRVGAAGDMQQGRSELEAAYNQLFHGPFEGAKVVQERGVDVEADAEGEHAPVVGVGAGRGLADL